MRIEQKITDMGLELAEATAPTANFVRTMRTGNLITCPTNSTAES